MVDPHGNASNIITLLARCVKTTEMTAHELAAHVSFTVYPAQIELLLAFEPSIDQLEAC